MFSIGMRYLKDCEYFNLMFNDIGYTGQVVFIDRSPHIFKHLLSYLRDHTYPYPRKYSSELNYFLIDLEDVTFYDPSDSVQKIANELASLQGEYVKLREAHVKFHQDINKSRDPYIGKERAKHPRGPKGSCDPTPRYSCGTKTYPK